MDPLRILIADDHPLFRDGSRMLLETTTDLLVVGEASTGDQTVTLAGSLQPDVILMDLKMPEGTGIEATRSVLAADPRVRILMIAMFEDDTSVFAAMRAGARGYVLKDTDKDTMLRAIRGVGQGEAIFSPAIATRVLHYFAASRPTAPQHVFPTLTEREREILDLLAQHQTNAQIAHHLALSPKTVSNYVSSMLGKLQVVDRAEAQLRARAAGLGEPR